MFELIDSVKKLRKWLAGKKTYISAILFGIFAGLKFYGIEIPGFVWPLLATAGLGSIRAALKKLENGGE